MKITLDLSERELYELRETVEAATRHVSEDDYGVRGTCACWFCGSFVYQKRGYYASIEHSTDCTGVKFLKQLNNAD